MTIHYHGTPITPNRVMLEMAGANFFVSYFAPAQLRLCHEIGQLVHIDWPAYSIWKQGIANPDINAYYSFLEPWLDYATTTATIPDLIEADEAENSRLVRSWPFRKEKGLPVFHMHEDVRRLITLVELYPWVAIGSSGQYAEVLSIGWERRMDEIFRHIVKVFGRIPKLHMMRGMQLLNSKRRWPFYSGDSTDIARNHNRDGNTASKMRARWDAGQCPPRFIDPGEQLEIAA